jgi:hypothetical protein
VRETFTVLIAVQAEGPGAGDGVIHAALLGKKTWFGPISIGAVVKWSNARACRVKS